MSRAVVLLSGGLDSATVLAMATSSNYECYCLTVDYGQRHKVELDSSKQIAKSLKAAAHEIVAVNLRQFGGSALTADIAVPKDEIGDGIPVTYVPARNTVMLSLALAYAESLGAWDIFCGVNAVDYSGYPDCRPEFIEAFEKMAQLATKAGVEGQKITIHAPLMELKKPEIIQQGLSLGLDYGLTHSCYDPSETGRACGHCDSCLIRIQAFGELGMVDPCMK